MQVRDLVKFSSEQYFNGAVQTEWFYDSEKLAAIAASYVFHGPRYYGVSQEDVQSGQHKLIDTASFARAITDKLYRPDVDNSFILTIAEYGTGKSHLAVTLGALFSDESAIRASVVDNITTADGEIGDYIRQTVTQPNLVIALNGMNNFNLDYEVLKCARLSLEAAGLDDESLRQLTRAYATAQQFVENSFAYSANRFAELAAEQGISLKGEALQNYLAGHLESNKDVFHIVNTVYAEFNGEGIHWDRGISAGDILIELSKQLCGKNKPYNKILLLFDEFGRYIEYAAANPTVAGEAALQQVFEAVQHESGKVLFVGFIQSDLNAYLSRIEKTTNIIRYVGRYEVSEKLYLSSNFETVLANLIKKKDAATYQKIIGNATEHYQRFHEKIRESLIRGDRAMQIKSVWSDRNLYEQVILNGCFPLHPITVWLLSNMSGWMQQRSTIAFVAEMFDNILDSPIKGNWLPYIYPIEILDSNIYNEMLNSEEKGLVRSQYCMLYQNITVKIGDKLSELEYKVLKAILIVNIARFQFRDQNDAVMMIQSCTNCTMDDVRNALLSLENMYGVTAFDDHANTYDLIAEASGFHEFKRLYTRYRLGVKVTIEDVDEEIVKLLELNQGVETSFAQESNISSTEWAFARKLLDSKAVDETFCKSVVASSDRDFSGENPRGMLLYVYCENSSQQEIDRIAELYRSLQMDKFPIIMLFLCDSDAQLLGALLVQKVLKRFPAAEEARFHKHIVDQNRSSRNRISQRFNQLVSARMILGSNGLQPFSGRISALCTSCFHRLYPNAPPFMFDGFEKKNTVQARKYHANICIKLFDNTLMNLQSYQALTQEEKNRVKAVLSLDGKAS